MVVFGLPLLLVYARLHWTGYPAFLAGGAFCAALTYSLLMRGRPESASLALFTAFGIVEGLFLRVMLFGALSAARQCSRMSYVVAASRPTPRAPAARSDFAVYEKR